MVPLASGFAWSIDWFGYVWQIGLLLTFTIALVIAVTPVAKTTLGDSVSSRVWLVFSMVQYDSLYLLAGGGGVFWAAGEPIAHFVSSSVF